MSEFWHGFRDTSARDYHADPCPVPSLSASVGHVIVDESAAHAYATHPRLGAKGVVRESSKEMDEGTLLHALMLGRGHEQIQVVTGPEGEQIDNYRTKAAQQARDVILAAGKTPALMREVVAVQSMAQVLAGRIRDRYGIALDPRHSERAVYWTERADDGTEVQCRAMLDNFDPETAIIYDLKRLKSAHPRSLRKYVEGQCIQQEAYRRAVIAVHPELAPRVRFQWLACEPRAPYEVTLAHPSASMEQLGGVKWRHAINRWAWCMKRDKWPGYAAKSVALEASDFALENAIVDSMDQWEDA